MPNDADAVISDLFGRRPVAERPGRARSMTRLDRGIVALDYGDDDHAFQLTVEPVPRRRWAPEQPLRIGHVDGVHVQLVGVTVDNFVHVHLTAEPTDERDRLTRSHTDAFERWAATAGETREDPPEDPARRLMQVSVAVNDNPGTVYGFHNGQSGGTGTEWEATQSFRPIPPAENGELRLTLRAPGQPEVSVTVTL